MYARAVGLSFMGAGITVWNVWDLPVWAWRRYCAEQDAALAEQRREQEAQRAEH